MSDAIKVGSAWVSHDGEITCTVVFVFENIVRLDFGGWADNYSVAELLREFVPGGTALMDSKKQALN